MSGAALFGRMRNIADTHGGRLAPHEADFIRKRIRAGLAAELDGGEITRDQHVRLHAAVDGMSHRSLDDWASDLFSGRTASEAMVAAMTDRDQTPFC